MSDPANPGPTTRAFILAIVMAGVAAQGLLRMPYYVGVLNDDACYVLRAFALSGGGKCLICDQVLTQGRDFPLGWPGLLSPLALLAKDHLVAYRGLSLVLTLGAAVVFGLLARRYFGARDGFLCSAALLASTGSLWLGTSTMSEPLFVLIICSLALLTYSNSRPFSSLVAGALTGWCLVTRTEGLAVLAALVFAAALTRRWRHAGVILATSLPLWIGVTLWRPSPSPHWSQIAQFFSSGPALWAYASQWAQQHAGLMAKCYFGDLGHFGTILVLALSLAAALGWYRWWKRESGFGPWLGLGLPCVLFLWPYLHLRYWYPLLPFWILGIAFALPRRSRGGALSAVVALQLIGAMANHRPDYQPTIDLYRALRQSPATAVVTCLQDCRTHIFCHRATVQPAGARSLAEMVAFMASAGSTHIIWETQSNLIATVHGEHQGDFVPDLPLWLERCPLFRVVASTPAGVVCELRVPARPLGDAFAAYREAFVTPDPAGRLAALERCLSIEPNFPGAKMLWAQTAVNVNGVSPLRVAQAIEDHLRTYPHDFPSTFAGLEILRHSGQTAALSALAKRAAAEAERLGRPSQRQALQPYLQASSPVR